LWVEALRVDPASRIGGVRVNIWMSLITIAAAGAWLWFRGRNQPDPAEVEPAATST
jgi:hypothetical protein